MCVNTSSQHCRAFFLPLHKGVRILCQHNTDILVYLPSVHHCWACACACACSDAVVLQSSVQGCSQQAVSLQPASLACREQSVLSCRPQHAVTISSPSTGIALEVDTTSPGLQFYSGGLLSVDSPVTGKKGVEYPQFGGFAVETQVVATTLASSDMQSLVLCQRR